MPSERLSFALSQLDPGDWKLFEDFAAEFLAVEFASLRTMAAPSGDRGRDGELFRLDEDPTTLLQYSVAADWRSKINRTLERLADTAEGMTRLIYVTSQVVGPAADDLRESVRLERGIALDIRDRSWFADRELTHEQRRVASDELVRRKVLPLLSSRGVAETGTTLLTGEDARVALLHLALDGYDKASDKGLTKSCFESLVLAVLHDTSADYTLGPETIAERVRALVPAGESARVKELTMSALARLSTKRGRVKHIARTDQYHLSFEAQRVLQERTAQFLSRQESVSQELAEAVVKADPTIAVGDAVEIGRALRVGVERVLLRRGEEFASTVVDGVAKHVDAEEVLSLLAESGTNLAGVSLETAAAVLVDVLLSPSEDVREHLRALADGYTLFAFLRQTPDVQRVMVQVFSGGEIWLDTSAILPVLAETLIDDPALRRFTVLLSAARDAGLKLYVIDGVVEEIERHLNRSLSCARTTATQWNGSVPFVYACYVASGRGREGFRSWLEYFRGDAEPEQDIKDYLLELGIRSRSLAVEADGAPVELRAAVREIWIEAHERRRRRRGETDPGAAVAGRLVAHDVENCVGVMELRRNAPSSPMGHRHWWLTLDSIAFGLSRELKSRLADMPPASPVLSPDFLTDLLRLGPLRTALDAQTHVELPILTSFGMREDFPIELIELAEQTREANRGLPERIVCRRVRDILNARRTRAGVTTEDAFRDTEEAVRASIRRDRLDS